MAKSKDVYIVKLNEIVTEAEKIYGLEQTNSLGAKYAQLDIPDVMAFVNEEVQRLDNTELSARNKEVGKLMMLFSYLFMRLRYFRKIKLDYSVYPHMDTVAKILLNFTERESISAESARELNKVITILMEIDARFVNYRYGLGYRYLRLFLIMVLYNNCCNASILASFILDQLIVKGA